MLEITRWLKKSLFFGSLNLLQLQAIAEFCRLQSFEKGEMIFHEGEPALHFIHVISGEVKIFRCGSNGKEQVFQIFGPKQPIGEAAVLLGTHYPADCIAQTQCRLIFMKRADFIRLIQIEPQLALDLMSVLAERLRLFNHIIAGLAFKEAPLRLAGFLYQCITDKFDRVAEVRLPFTKSELAKILGMTPETLSRGFSRLKAEGFITISGRKITILDPSGLAKMIE